MARGNGLTVGNDDELPSTTRIGPTGSGRGLRTIAALVAVGIALAVLKPWDLVAPRAVPGQDGERITTPSPTVGPTPTLRDWTDLGGEISCLSDRIWLAVVDQVDGSTVSRSWTRLDVVPAGGPTDPAMARVHVYADAVPRLGFCAPTAIADAGAGSSPESAFRVRAWRLDHAATSRSPGTSVATEITLVVASGGTHRDRGVLYAPSGVPAPGATVASGPAPESASWPPGTYAFRVELQGAGPAGSDIAWLAIELRGPWTGPGHWSGEATPTPTPTPTPGSSIAP